MSRKLATSVLLVAAAASFGLYLSRVPWMAYREQKQKADSATKEMQKAEQGKNDLLRQQAITDSPMGRERIVRAQGYHRAGEEVIPDH